jgi:uncharacterized membrane protein YheB (UPF0754 family)
MPLLAAFIGYVTKLVAIEMMFRPVEFVGVRPLFGWQGVIPRNVGRIGSIAVNLLLGRLVDPSQIMARMDPGRFTDELREPLRRVVTEIGTDLMTRYQPRLWEALPERARRLLLRRIAEQARRRSPSCWPTSRATRRRSWTPGTWRCATWPVTGAC